MSRGDLNEANIRAKRWARAASEAGLIKGGANPEVQTSALWPLSSRWRVVERMTWTLDGTADGPKVDTEACVATAPSWGELLHKYSLWAKDENRQAYFRDRHLRGESLMQPPPNPPEWAEYRKAAVEASEKAAENTAAWVKRSARAKMAHIGLDDTVKFEAAWANAKALGLVKG